jgi:multicomponent Na+:H+ antiporter subunit D
MLLLPIMGIWQLTQLTHGLHVQIELFDQTLTLLRVDKLSLVFGYIFFIAAELSIIYAWHIKDLVQQVAGLAYAGAAIGAVFAGDLVSLFVFWELTAITSVFLIWAVRTDRSLKIGLRYLLIQVGSGVLLLTGALVLRHETNSIAFEHIGIESLGGILIFIAFGIKAAFPLLHNWLQDSYPEATVTGTVFLSAFTTKLAIYALARGYAGTEILIWIGAVMTAFPIFFAVIENNLRRVLTYSLNNQLGFMVVGIGIGTELALNGAASHSFAHI